jgi:Ca2+/H+ antiporter
MDTDQFLMELLKGVSGNTNVITELRRAVDTLPVKSELNKTEEDLKKCFSKIEARLDDISVWQKIKLPFIIGVITLVLYGIGFFFTLNRVASMIEEKHPVAISRPNL